MSLRARFALYLAALHVLLAVVAVYLLRDSLYWLFAVEAVFLASLITGITLTRRAFRSLGLAAEGVRLIREGELTSRFREVGDPDVDALIGVYNHMVDTLREERTRVQEQHQFLSRILDVSPAGIVVLDFEGAVSSVNPAAVRLLGCASEDVAGRPLAALASPLAPRLAALAPGAAEVVGLSGARRVKIHHGTFQDRGFARSFLLLEELTEELRQFERAAYEKLIRVMSHEVNNSVAASNSLLHSSLTYGRELPPASRTDFEEAIGIVIERTEQLNAFMRRFADVFRLPVPVREDVALVPLLEAIVRLQRARPEAAGVQWRWDVEDPDARARLDRGQFEQALLNIVKNAVEAAGPGGSITLRQRTVQGRTELSVEDSGPGIGAEAQANLFTPFFSTKPHGQGIGLTLVQEVLVAHGFDFALEAPPGGPTRFSIRL